MIKLLRIKPTSVVTVAQKLLDTGLLPEDWKTVAEDAGGEIDLERVPERRRPHAVVGGVDELMEWL